MKCYKMIVRERNKWSAFNFIMVIKFILVSYGILTFSSRTLNYKSQLRKNSISCSTYAIRTRERKKDLLNSRTVRKSDKIIVSSLYCKFDKYYTEGQRIFNFQQYMICYSLQDNNIDDFSAHSLSTKWIIAGNSNMDSHEIKGDL